MKNKLPESSLKQLFTEARTFSGWLKYDVSTETLHEIYELMKWGPTSANGCPMRLLFIKSKEEKEKLFPCLEPTNVEKVKGAPVTAVIAMDEKFFNELPRLFPHAPGFKDIFSTNEKATKDYIFRNSSLQGAYFILAARALGLDCGPMSGFDNKKLDETFFTGTSLKSNFICNIGYGDITKLHPRGPRLTFNEACKII